MGKQKKPAKSIHPTLSDKESSLIFAIVALLLVGIYYSTALTTISMAGMVLVCLRHCTLQKITDLPRDTATVAFLLVFLAVFLSGSYSADKQEWLTGLRVRLPFLAIPMAISFLPSLREEFVVRLHYWMIALSVVVGLPVMAYALGHMSQVVDLVSRGQAIPTPIEHVKYSMFNSYAGISGVILLTHKAKSIDHIYRWLFRIGVIFITILLHLLAVRTGLVIFYISLIILASRYAYQHGSIKVTALCVMAVIVLPFLAYFFLPTVKQKIGYMLYDWHQYADNNGHHYSDSERIMSYHAAWEIWKSNPIIGTGYGDVRQEAHLFYDSKYQRADLFKLPHSQFLLTLAGSGLLGLVIFLAGFYVPLLYTQSTSLSWMLLSFLYLNYTLSFFVENSLERSISVAFFVVLASLLIKSNTTT